MRELNLPERFARIATKAFSQYKLHGYSNNEIQDILKALSDARNESQEKSNEIVALNLSLENAEAENKRLREQIDDKWLTWSEADSSDGNTAQDALRKDK